MRWCPILDVMSRPASTIAEVVGAVRDLAALRAENVRLREENANLMHWQTLARQLDNENRALRGQLNFVPDPDPSFVTTRVVGDTGGAFVHSMLVNSGPRRIRKGQAVIAGEVLVGRIAEVGQRSARVLLLTDINSHIPVMLEGLAGQIDPDRRQYGSATTRLSVVQHQRGARRSRREFRAMAALSRRDCRSGWCPRCRTASCASNLSLTAISWNM